MSRVCLNILCNTYEEVTSQVNEYLLRDEGIQTPDQRQAQQTNTCLKSTIETQKNGVKYVQS